MDITFYINLLILDPHMLQAGTRPESANFHQEEHDSSGSRTTDPHEELPDLPMPQNETHKLPLSSRTHPATRPTTNRPKTNHQHPSRRNQEILRYIGRTEVLGPRKGTGEYQNLPFKRNSRCDRESTPRRISQNTQRTLRNVRGTRRVSPHIPTRQLDQDHITNRGLRADEKETAPPQYCHCAT